MNSKQSGRRRFLKGGAAIAGLAMGGVRFVSGQTVGSEIPEVGPSDARAYGVRSRFVTSVRGPLPIQYAPLGESMGIITPTSLHYTIGRGGTHHIVSSNSDAPVVVTSSPLPDIHPRQHRLLIHGMVDHPLILTMEVLMRFPSVSRIHFLQCAGGNDGGSKGLMMFYENVQQMYWKTGCSEWTGVLLSVLLKEAGVQKGASWVVAEGAEEGKHTRSIPLEKAMYDVIVAYGQNGEPVRPEQGYPLKLVVPGFEGNINVKWLRRIKVVDQPYMTRSETAFYASQRPDGKSRWFQFEMPPDSVITSPSIGQHLSDRGFYEIRGLAWSGGGAIRRVEVSTDGGRNYKDAQLQEPVHRIAHTRFRFPWDWDGQEVVIQSRCTDELGQVQPTLAELSGFLGVSMDDWKSKINYKGHVNPIQPWRVTREGSLQNALFG